MTRIILVDDHIMMRQGLRTMLEKEPDMEVVAEAGDGLRGVELVREHAPDVVIMDITLPGINGIEAASRIIGIAPSTRIVGLSMHQDKRFITEMLQAGASGYMPKECAFEELLQGIRTVVANKMYISPQITRTIMRNYLHQERNTDHPKRAALTAKECEVLRLQAQGKSTREIAQTLGVSIKTIETHRRHMLEKLNVHSLAELIKYAIREGIASLED